MPGAKSIHETSFGPIALNVEGATAPEWIELIPPGPNVQGHDGRRWTMTDANAVVADTRAANRPMALDWEHAGHIRATQGLDAPAAGWIEELQARNGAIWGRVAWTPRGAEQVAAREYRFVSPTFAYDAVTSCIKRLTGAGLTNNPNLHLTAMNRAEPHSEPENSLDLALLRTALELPADATDEAILAKAREKTAANKTVDLVAYAPRGELTEAVNRANGLQGQLDTIKGAARDAAIEVALDAAQSAGKITPASRPEYLAMCKVEGGLERFEKLAATLPVVVSGAPVVKGGKPETAADPASGLSAEQLAVCKAFGTDPVAYAKSLKEA